MKEKAAPERQEEQILRSQTAGQINGNGKAGIETDRKGKDSRERRRGFRDSILAGSCLTKSAS